MSALVIDDHPLVLEGCRDILQMAHIDTVFLAASLTDGIHLYRRHRPTIILLDLAFPSEPVGGLSFLTWLRQRDTSTRVIVLTMHADPGTVRRAIKAGADAFVLKSAATVDLIDALQKVRTGSRYISPSVAADLAFEVPGSDTFGHLTLRELETLKLIGEGERYDMIAGRLHVSYKTVVNTVANLKRKLGIDTLGELTLIAVTSSLNAQAPEPPAWTHGAPGMGASLSER